MAVAYGFTIENTNLIIDKAKTKPNGIYSFRGVVFKVKDGNVTHYAADNVLYQATGRFTVRIGSYSGYKDGAVKALKSID